MDGSFLDSSDGNMEGRRALCRRNILLIPESILANRWSSSKPSCDAKIEEMTRNWKDAGVIGLYYGLQEQ